MDPRDAAVLSESAPPEWPLRLAAAIQDRRNRLGLSQHRVALLAGVGDRLVHELEHGKSSARLENVVAVLTVLGLQLTVVEGVDGLTVPDHG
jgi:y4mF family transcriptional regulator